MSFDAAAWDRDVKKLFKDVDEELLEIRRRIVTQVFLFIVNNSPVYSGYYAANHKIVIGGLERTGGDFPRHPRNKSDDEDAWVDRGAFVDLIGTNEEAQLAKLNQRDKDGAIRKVTIGTSVPYADAAQAEHLYALAAAQIVVEIE